MCNTPKSLFGLVIFIEFSWIVGLRSMYVSIRPTFLLKNGFFNVSRDTIVGLTTRHRIPSPINRLFPLHFHWIASQKVGPVFRIYTS